MRLTADFTGLVTPGATDPRISVARALAEMRSQVLGYDYGDREARRIVAAYSQHRRELASGDAGIVRLEMAVLHAFVDIVLISRNRRTGADETIEDVHSPRESFHAFLETTDTTQAGLPPGFTRRLRDAVAGYQVAGLERTGALEEALLRMFLAQQRHATLLSAVLAILRFYLDHPDVPVELRPNCSRRSTG